MSAFLDQLDGVLAAGASGRLPLLQRYMPRHQRTWLTSAARRGVRPDAFWEEGSRSFVEETYPRLCLLSDHTADALAEQVDRAIAAFWHPTSAEALDPDILAATAHLPDRVADLIRGLRPAGYALRLGLLVAQRERLRLSKAGEAIYGLVGREKARLLLALEVSQSQGPEDRWRITRGLLKCATDIGFEEDTLTLDYDSLSAAGWRNVERMQALFGLPIEPQLGTSIERVGPAYPGGQALVEPVLLEDSPLLTLARALLADEHVSVVGDPQGRSATDTAVTQARRVAHEIHNILLPTRAALKRLRREDPSPDLARLGAGLDRIERFVDQLGDTARLIKGGTTFGIGAAIDEAVGDIQAEMSHTAAVDPGIPDVHLDGDRRAFVDAIRDVLRNAWQAHSDARVTLRVALSADGRRLRLSIDDDGPGVPENMREAIFLEGTGMRDGGSGFGLFMARRAIQEMAGTIHCTAAPGGGARFLIDLPVVGETR